MYNDENTSYPGRPPKKFPDKSLHGRVRSAYIPYENLSRAQKFYVNVFDWDMFALPPNVLAVCRIRKHRMYVVRQDRHSLAGKVQLQAICRQCWY